MRDTRDQRFHELQSLVRIQHEYHTSMRPNARDTVADIIDELLDELFPPTDICTGDALTCERPDCCQGFDPQMYRITDDDIDEASDLPQVEYMSLEEATNRLETFKGGRLARKGWDNGLNQEYIEYLPMVGLVKIYQTSSVKTMDLNNTATGKPYFKNVVHTFDPTQDELSSRDWYFL